MRKRQITKIIAAVLLCYGVLLFLLITAENTGTAQERGITDFGAALWYLIATLTTVGYGDVTPHTGAGKLIGAFIMVSSAGVLTFFLGLMFSLFFGRLLPGFRMWRYRRKNWYVFTSLDESSQLLAKELAAKDMDAAYIFLCKGNTDQYELLPDIKNIVITDTNPQALFSIHDPSVNINIFYMSKDGWKNYDNAWALLKIAGDVKVHVFCETDHTPDQLPSNMTVFSRADITARSFWLNYPLNREEEIILLVGDGKLSRSMLERALLINVFPADHQIEYHVFGDWTDFRKDHFMLSYAVSINEKKPGLDSIFFHDGAFNDSSKLPGRASRIIFCDDEESDNLAKMAELNRYFPVKGRIYVCAGVHETTGAVFFGSDELIFTRDKVIHDRLNHIAIQLNELYRQKSNKGKRWEELMQFHRESNIAAADHLLTKVRILLPEENPRAVTANVCERAYKIYCTYSEEQKEALRMLEHKRWMRFHFLNNWQYAPVRNDELRHHNLLISYKKLTVAQQSLDDSAWEILNEVK